MTIVLKTNKPSRASRTIKFMVEGQNVALAFDENLEAEVDAQLVDPLLTDYGDSLEVVDGDVSVPADEPIAPANLDEVEPVIEEDPEPEAEEMEKVAVVDETPDNDFSNATVAELRAIAKDLDLPANEYRSLKKAALIAYLQDKIG